MVDWLRRLFSAPAHDLPLSPREAVPALAVACAAPIHDSLGVSWLTRSEVSADFSRWVFETDADSALFITPIEQQVLDAIEAIVHSKQSGVNLVRRMPGLIPQLLQSLRSDDFSGAELARKISNDVVLVAEVFRLANSAFYSTEQSITSIEHAVLVLGQNGLRQLISGVAFKPIIGPNSGRFTRQIAPRLWQQAEQCALANRMLANAESVDQFEAFLAGLIQNVGLIAALRVIEQIVDDDASLGSESFCNVLIEQSRKLTCSIAREWQFPATIIAAIEQQGNQHGPARMSPLARILANGDYLSKVQLLEAHERLSAGARDGLSTSGEKCLEALRAASQSAVDDSTRVMDGL